MKKAGEGNDDVKTRMYRLALEQLFTRLTMSFDNPARPKVVLFQNHMCSTGVVKGWLAVFNHWGANGEVCRTDDVDSIGVETNDILGDRVSPGYGSLDCYVKHGTETDTLVKYVARSVGKPKPDGHGRLDTVRPVSGSFVLV